MATPHVAGTAALIWSAFPDSTVAELRGAILTTVDSVAGTSNLTSSAGRINASRAVNADVFAPSARILSKQNISTAGGTSTEFIVQYFHRNGINASTIGNDDLLITRQWGPTETYSATLKPGSIVASGKTLNATYTFNAPGGSWDALDYGDYVVSTVAGKVASSLSNQLIESRAVGSFNVRIVEPSVLYVSTLADSTQPGSLRSAIIAANAAASSPRTIILENGNYAMDISPSITPGLSFPLPNQRGYGVVGAGVNVGGWSNADSGDFDITGSISIYGNQADQTVIDAKRLDRVFKVGAGATLSLNRVTVTGGSAPINQPGGGILSTGTLRLDQVIVADNKTNGTAQQSADGGGIAVVGGTANILRSRVTRNIANASAGVLFAGFASGTIEQSTLDANQALDLDNQPTYGAALGTYSLGSVDVKNSTLALNRGVTAYASFNYGIPKPNSFGFSLGSIAVSADGNSPFSLRLPII